MNDIELYKAFQKSPILFIEKMWNLKPQPLKKEFQGEANEILQDVSDPEWSKKFRVEMFEKFEKGKHITWQQWLTCKAVEFALAGQAHKRITIESGHGIGKSATIAMLCLWYLFCYKNAQIPCTAPTADQMYDVLWKEIKVWLDKMPQEISNLYEWSMSYVRIKESSETWFARAKTARKEAPEALAGIHSDYVMMLIDEASGVPEEIFKTAEGALTSPNILVIMISNHTRLIGFFHDSHTRDKKNWQVLSFNSEQSPIVDKSFVERIEGKYGRDSDEFRIRVQGTAPKADMVDDKGYVPLLLEEDLRMIDDNVRLRNPNIGIDPAGEGRDTSAFVGRDTFRAKILAEEKISTTMTIALKGTTLADLYQIDGSNVIIDNFGVGANVSQEMAHAKLWTTAINVGEKSNEDRFLNKRAEGYFKLRDWLRSGGELVRDERWKELLNLRFKRNLSGKIQIMSKFEMAKEGIPSPNVADALMLTFLRDTHENKHSRLSPEEILNLTKVY